MAHLSDKVQIDIRLIIITIFYVVLSMGARKRWLNVKELTAAGVVLAISSALMLLPFTLKAAIMAYGPGQKAMIWGAAPVVIFVAFLVGAIVVMIRWMKNNPEPVAGATPTSVQPTGPVPKPKRVRGGKRRF